MQDFNASQDEVKVVLTVVPGDAWEQKIKAAQAAGKAPDMYTMNYSAVPMNARNGQLAPIGDLIDTEGRDDLDTRFFDAVTVKDEQYAYPIYYEPSALLFYRTDLYEAAGLDPDRSAEDMDEPSSTRGSSSRPPTARAVPFQIAQNAVGFAGRRGAPSSAPPDTCPSPMTGRRPGDGPQVRAAVPALSGPVRQGNPR